MYRVPLQQVKINYTVSTTNKKVYTEEEDRFLLVMLDKYGVDGEGLYEKIRDEIRESPLFRFDWFFLSRTPVEIGRRCTTLLNTVAKEFETDGKANGESGKGRGRDRDDDEAEEDEAPPAKKKTKGGAVVSCLVVPIYITILNSSANKPTEQASQGRQGWQQGKFYFNIAGSQCLFKCGTQVQESQEMISSCNRGPRWTMTRIVTTIL